MSKIKAHILQLNGSDEQENFASIIVFPEKGCGEVLFHIGDSDSHDKYFFRDLDFTLSLGEKIFEVMDKYEAVSFYRVDDYDGQDNDAYKVAQNISYNSVEGWYKNMLQIAEAKKIAREAFEHAQKVSENAMEEAKKNLSGDALKAFETMTNNA